MIFWYDRAGRPFGDANCDHEKNPKKWAKMMKEVDKKLTDPKYKIVKQERTWYGAFVSTVWLGLDHSFSLASFGNKPNPHPIIFETMVFGLDGHGDLDMERYETEWEAKLGHKRIFEEWNSFSGLLRAVKSLISNAWYETKWKVRRYVEKKQVRSN